MKKKTLEIGAYYKTAANDNTTANVCQLIDIGDDELGIVFLLDPGIEKSGRKGLVYLAVPTNHLDSATLTSRPSCWPSERSNSLIKNFGVHRRRSQGGKIA